jgi:uncharacterized iron-regulated membrane protein
VLGRRIHYWLAIGVALPALVIFATGVLLQVKKQLTWVQPKEFRGSGTAPALSLPQVLEVARTVPEAGIRDWGDIDRVDVRPSRGMLKVTSRTRWEIQIDTSTGAVLQSAYRRSDLIESIHDGSFFHPWAKLGLFLPAGIVLFLMLVSGMYLFWLPVWVRARRKRALAVPLMAVCLASLCGC